MAALLPVLILATAAALGAFMLTSRGARRPGMIGAHLLLGIGGAEAVVMLLHGSGLDEQSPTRDVAKLALSFLVAAIFSGFAAPIFGRGNRVIGNSLLTAHACCGFVGFVAAFVFASQL